MDAATVFQYRWLVIAAAAGFVLAAAAVALVRSLAPGRRAAWAPEREGPGPGDAGRAVQYVLALLVALAVVMVCVLLLPVTPVFRFLAGWKVALALVAVIALAAAPLVHLWRARPF